MPVDDQFLRGALVFASGTVYWLGVVVQARRVRRQIGHAPNLRPRGIKEWVLWAAWALVIGGWVAQPFFLSGGAAWLKPWPWFTHRLGLIAGLALLLAGYAGTLWCYVRMGNTWRIGINPGEKTVLVTRGPYRWLRHPIYSFQVLMLAGAAVLLPTWFSLLLLVVCLVCVRVKAADEESYLLAVHGETYRHYTTHTGGLLPRLRGESRSQRNTSSLP